MKKKLKSSLRLQ